MKVSLFEQVPYRYMPEGFENHHEPMVATRARYDGRCRGSAGRREGVTTVNAADVRDETVEAWDNRLRLHVKVAGDGPPLLYLHPLPGLAWQPFLD